MILYIIYASFYLAFDIILHIIRLPFLLPRNDTGMDFVCFIIFQRGKFKIHFCKKKKKERIFLQIYGSLALLSISNIGYNKKLIFAEVFLLLSLELCERNVKHVTDAIRKYDAICEMFRKATTRNRTTFVISNWRIKVFRFNQTQLVSGS